MRYAVIENIDGREIILIKPTLMSDAEVVLAKYGTQFVTWERLTKSPNDFYWGHYFNSLESALTDFIER